MPEVKLQFKLLREARSNYDSNLYELVNTYGTPFTVRDVLMFVIGQNDWGIIEIVNPYISDNLPRLIYSKTQFIKSDGRYESDLGGYDRNDIWPAEVESVRANGGWSEMNYVIRLKDPSVLNPSGIVKKLHEDPDQLPLVPALSKYKIKAQGAAKEEIDIWVEKIQEELASGDMTITIPVGWEIIKDV